MKIQQRFALLGFAILVALAVAVIALIIAVGNVSVAHSDVPPIWAGEAGQANHACYYRHGVKMLYDDDGTEDDVVCNDGWAIQIDQ